MVDTVSFADFVAANRLAMHAINVPVAPDGFMDDPDEKKYPRDWWLCTFKTNKRAESFYFGTGRLNREINPSTVALLSVRDRYNFRGLPRVKLLNPPRLAFGFYPTPTDAELMEYFRPVAPSLRSVLSCLAMDAQAVDNADFADWSSSFGYDEDSRRAHRIYKLGKRNASKLRALLGRPAYNDLTTGRVELEE